MCDVRWLGPAILLCSGCSYYDASLLAGQDAGRDADVRDVVDAGDAFDVADGGEGSVDGSVDGGGDVSNEGSTPCVYARPPDQPDGGSGGDLEFIVAVREINFGDVTGNPKEIGFDLDSRCTCDGEGSACLRESWASAEACDGPGGRDNAAGVLLSEMAPLFSGFGSARWSQGAVEGSWSVLLRVRNYNGLADDRDVRLDWYVPGPYWADKSDKSDVPSWDGTDTWPIQSNSLVEQGGKFDIDRPKVYDEHAYVTGGVLVGSLSASAFQVSKDYTIDLSGAFITAKVVEGAQGWTLQDGVLAGRWKLSGMLAQASRIEIFSVPVCMDHPAYGGVKEKICALADIHSGLGGPTTPCDSISAGLEFQASPAGFGNIVPHVVAPSPCDPSVDPEGDECGS
jgi:hypothetical protein